MGLTKGINSFADELRGAGHTVHVPDLFDGHLFTTIEDGMTYVNEIGFEEITERGIRVASEFPREIIYAGFSLGVVAVQKLAQTREGARGALLFYSCVPARCSDLPGRRNYRCRFTAWTRIPISLMRATLRRHASS
ncbi:hypothetical protein [Paenibacillus sp. N3.4]|uniref:hypothetical protein n=1 Tax=Paenibacillus sp. N3.4 TaxID=2603222 RepID=UPI0021C2ED12|nr:hypothetical protein [Paenibacillus sp. N3.4]